MRIAYIAPYQGLGLVKNRPCLLNLSLAARVKMELISELLQSGSHQVEILSQGEVVQHRFKFYPAFCEPNLFHPKIPVYYASAFPVRRLNGLWSSLSTLRLFMRRHRASPYDLVMIYNLKLPQVTCANYAIRRLGLPVILEYEDDAFSDVWGMRVNGFRHRWQLSAAKRLLNSVSGGVAVSPYLLSKMPSSIPKLLLSGVVSTAFLNSDNQAKAPRRNWVVFSGTHETSQGLEQLVTAWGTVKLPDWELHIAGQGPLTPALEKMAENSRTIVFHGLLNREENARLLCVAKIGMNPQDVTQIPGNVFAFKIIEYLAAGTHVITTPRGTLESELEAGITYVADNDPDAIASCLKKVIANRLYEHTAEQAALQIYGPSAVSKSLIKLIEEVTAGTAN